MTDLEACQKWVDDMVVGLDLCPFAREPIRSGRVGWTTCGSAEFEEQLHTFLVAVDELVRVDAKTLSTTIIVYGSGALASFDDYLDLLFAAEAVLEDLEVDHLVQLASFHPEYQFDGSEPDDPANATNRSPAPMLHLLRVDEVEEAIARHPDIDAIPERNAALMRERAAEGQ